MIMAKKIPSTEEDSRSVRVTLRTPPRETSTRTSPI